MLIETTQFPVRPARRDGESLAGFVARHYGTNGHWMPEALHRAVATVYGFGDPAERLAAWRVVGQVIGGMTAEDKERWLDRPTDSRIKKLSGRDWHYAPYTRVKFCPACLRQHGIHLAIWELPLVRACIVHRNVLLDACACGRRVAWRSVGPGWSCRCERLFSDLTLETASDAQLALTATVLVSDGVRAPVEYFPESLKTAALPPRRLSTTFENILFLHSLRTLIALHSVPPRKGKHFPTAAVGRLLVHWPDRFHRSLIRLIRFQCRKTSGLFVDAEAGSWLAIVLTHLEAAAQRTELSSDIRNAASTVVSAVNAPISTTMRVIFRAGVEVAERERQLACFASWWTGVAEMIDPLDPSAPSFLEIIRTPHSFLELMKSRQVVMALNILVSAANRSCPVKAFRRVAMAWPPSVSTHGLPPMGLVGYLTEQLETVSFEHRHHLVRLIQIAGVETPNPS